MRTDTSGDREDARTVVGVDGSEYARAAALWGAAGAVRNHHSLCLVHAADLDRLERFASFETSEHVREHGNTVLAEAAQEVRHRFPGLDLTLKLSRRSPVPALHAAARPGDVIVVGSRGSGGFGPLLLGSVGLEAVVGSPVPVVVVRGGAEDEDGSPVTAAVRDEQDAAWLVRAAQEAQARKGSLRLLNVRNLLSRFGSRQARPDEAGRLAAPGERLLADLAARIREDHPGLTVRTEVLTARSTASALVEASRGAGLLVMGSHERRGASVLGLGHVVHALLHHSHCPVQIVPYPRDERGVVEEGPRDDDD
ncbi:MULTISPECIES: universal stress protein [Streptomyces]|uniref:Nucleotide-binding universal stress UspA family protein n=1 Tax=Streptomyces clavifer TaxID=68188 RepID=A0ABS4VJF1_9ACTN|nr:MULTISPECIES: universal stress protein [Streptomyces]KQZ19801.1 universal stress protein UspA [Streptomyces sp. Root55]MBP2363926.1 nucleotide-binding universal stress UspA family protein [Streptomyces clavifer]MDX2744636.1 universal stress protein [Streptomyces sp. NRRL_B-2557]MDX3066196.1 universal stress protein [Streptomyces sp. ND04-05B]RPK85786.1 Universal stress protein [Streptomyces sp. ADI97-07]